MLILKLDFDEILLGAEVNDCPLKRGLDQSLDRPGFPALNRFLVNDPGASPVDDLFNLLLSFSPVKSEGRVDMFSIVRLSVRDAEQQPAQKPQNPPVYPP